MGTRADARPGGDSGDGDRISRLRRQWGIRCSAGCGRSAVQSLLQDQWSELEAITDRVRDSSGRIGYLAIDPELLSRAEAAEQ